MSNSFVCFQFLLRQEEVSVSAAEDQSFFHDGAIEDRYTVFVLRLRFIAHRALLDTPFSTPRLWLHVLAFQVN